MTLTSSDNMLECCCCWMVHKDDAVYKVGWLVVGSLVVPVLYSDNTGNKGPGMVYGIGLPELWYYGASSYVG